MTRRMLTALVALVGLFVAFYLALYKAGVIGTLACGTGSCETVQMSKYAMLFGVPVANWGVLYYAAFFALAFVATLPRWAEDRRASLVLLAMASWGVLFSGYLTYLELFRIHAICRYCVVSACLVLALLGLTLRDYVKTQPAT